MSNGRDNGDACELHLFEKMNYFYGKLMTVRDFQAEQAYFDGKRWLINRLMYGPGIVYGFRLQDEKDGTIRNLIHLKKGTDGNLSATIADGGVALDCCGREIVVPDKTERTVKSEAGVAVSFDKDTYYLYLKYRPCKTEMVNAASSQSSCDEVCCPNRIQENFEIIGSTEPLTSSHAYFIPADCPEEPTKEKFEAVVSKFLEDCPPCDPDSPLVFIACITTDNDDGAIDEDESAQYRTLIFPNLMLEQLVSCHLTEANPHGLGIVLNSNLSEPPSVKFNESGVINLNRQNTIQRRKRTAIRY